MVIDSGNEELNNDFYTVWSRYLLNNNDEYASTDGLDCIALAALANLGQINAVQSVILFNDIFCKRNKDVMMSIVDLEATVSTLDGEQ